MWNWNDKYVHSVCSSLENHTRFQTKGGKVYTGFQLDQNGAKTLPDGRNVPTLFTGVPVPTPDFLLMAIIVSMNN